MDPFMGGGEMIAKVALETATWAEIPHKFEAGTPHIGGVIALGAAIEYLQRFGMDRLAEREHELAEAAVERLAAVPGLRLHGRAARRGGAISFTLDGAHPHDVGQFLDQEGIAIRAGHLCAQPLMKRLGVPAVNRASLYFYNLHREIDRLADALVRAREYFGHGT
jgi:cysteine desulfurase/selenocysteine lyase